MASEFLISKHIGYVECLVEKGQGLTYTSGKPLKKDWYLTDTSFTEILSKYEGKYVKVIIEELQE